MQDLLKNIIVFIVGGVIVALFTISAERSDGRAPELLILQQKTALPDEFVRTVINGSVKYLNNTFTQDNEPFQPERLEEFSNSLIASSGLRFGGSMDTYYIKNESKDEPITFKILSRDFEFAALGGDRDEQYFQDEIDTEIRLLPNEVVYFVLVSDKSVSIRFPNMRLNEQYVFFAVEDRPIAPIPLSDYSPYDIFPERLIKDNILIAAFLSFCGLILIVGLTFFGFIGIFTEKKIAILAWMSPASDIVQHQLVIDYVRDHDTKKFAAVEVALEALRVKS